MTADLPPALDRDDLDATGQTILDAIEAAHLDDLLYGGSSLDPSGWSNSTFPEAARRIRAALAAPPLQGSSSSQSPTPATPSLDVERLARAFSHVNRGWLPTTDTGFWLKVAAEYARLTAAASSEEGTWEPSADDPREWGDYFADREDPA